jgi:hypothetical protein
VSDPVAVAQSVIDQISAEFPAIKCKAEFDRPKWWLTFYLTAVAEKLQRAVEGLRGCGACNLDDWESGFLYAKVPVASELPAVIDAALAVVEICDAEGVKLINIDVDTSPDVRASRFATIYDS